MKGSTIAAMVISAVAASAATIFALKRAHDKRLEAACNCDDLPESTRDLEADDYDDEMYDDFEDEYDDAPASSDAPAMHCADGVCTLAPETDESTDADTPDIPMPESLNEDTDEVETAS